jgi:hypothetical protein
MPNSSDRSAVALGKGEGEGPTRPQVRNVRQGTNGSSAKEYGRPAIPARIGIFLVLPHDLDRGAVIDGRERRYRRTISDLFQRLFDYVALVVNFCAPSAQGRDADTVPRLHLLTPFRTLRPKTTNSPAGPLKTVGSRAIAIQSRHSAIPACSKRAAGCDAGIFVFDFPKDGS